MATHRITAPDGSTYEVAAPAGASDADVLAYVQSQHQAPPSDTSAVHGAALGAIKPIDNAVSAIADTGIVRAIDKAGVAMGFPSATAAVASNDAGRANNTRTGYQTLGNIAGTLPLAALKGGAAVQGAISGAALSDKKDLGGVATDALMGAGTGLAGGALLKGAANIAQPYVSRAAAALRDAGAPMTIGQLAQQAGSASGFVGRTLGNAAKGIEDASTSIPILGPIIKGAQDRGTIAYNQSVLNRALSGIGAKLPANIAPGRESIAATADALSKGYQALVPKLTATTDLAFKSGVDSAVQSTLTLPDSVQKQFRAILTDVFKNRMTPGNALGVGAKLAGQDLKDAESALTKKIAAYSGPNADPDQRGLADALSQVRDEFRALVSRSNPADAKELGALNSGWAQLKTAEKASLASSGDGIFTPKQYAQAAKAADTSKSATAQGRFPNQTLTDAAASVLPNATPDSGTSGRAMNAMGLHALATGGAATVSPALAGTLAMAALPHTPLGQKAVNTLFLGNRGAIGATMAVPLRQLAQYAPTAAPALVAHRGQ